MPSEYISPPPQDSSPNFMQKIDLHENSSNLSYYVKKNIQGGQVRQKRTSLNRQLFPKGTKWDIGRQVGRSKKAKKRGTSLMDVPFPNSSPVEVIASTNILHCLRNSFMFCIYHSHCNSSPECYLTKLVLLVVSFGNYVD